MEQLLWNTTISIAQGYHKSFGYPKIAQLLIWSLCIFKAHFPLLLSLFLGLIIVDFEFFRVCQNLFLLQWQVLPHPCLAINVMVNFSFRNTLMAWWGVFGLFLASSYFFITRDFWWEILLCFGVFL